MKEYEGTWKYVFVLQRSADTFLFGRVMYPGFEKYWLANPKNPSSTKNEIENEQHTSKKVNAPTTKYCLGLRRRCFHTWRPSTHTL